MKTNLKLSLTILSLGIGAVARADLNIVTTTADLASIAQSVGGAKVRVSSIVTGARDPHRIEAKPSFMSRARSADLWLAIGLELEIGYERPILDGSGNGKIRVGGPGHVYVSQWARVRDVPSGAVTRAQGDIHPFGNPHIWLDPYNGRSIALRLGEKMGALDPGNAATYKSNAAAFARKLDEAMFGEALVGKFGGDTLWGWDDGDKLVSNLRDKGALDQLGGWAAKMRPFWGKPIVTYHRSWNYFAYRFGLKIVAELEPKPGLEPTPGHIAGVIKTVEAQGVKVLLQEPYYSKRSAEFVASRTSASAVVAPGSVGHESAARDYITLIDAIVSRVSAAMAK
ncbi:MAG TPA: metal ABC transporter substrate-binding protein [Fimbriimonadaceae bacterium]|nr:metal ABC transporter substrate-binding protein [Fimbriimonadaceae bacterium]